MPEPPAAYVIPVAGVETWELTPTFGLRRSEDHVHEGIDIMAPAGTPVLAVTDGVVYDSRPNRVGGNVIWLLGAGRQLYYFAHLRELASGIRPGRVVRAGERIGSVGNTGNAIQTPAHLHFEILEVTGDFLPLSYRELDPYTALARRGRSLPAQASEAVPTPPRWQSIPLEPAQALELGARGIAARARSTADRVEGALAGLDAFLGADADGDARRLGHLQRLAPRLRARAQELGAAGEPSAALAEAPPSIRALATRLFLATEQVDSILFAWTHCDPRHLSVALAALQGISIGMETQAPAEDGGPPMLYFFFEGHRPSIVPPEGGWLVAAGHDLANASAHKLELRVRGSGRSVAKLAARPLGADALAVWLPPETLAPHAGDCLSLTTETADPAETGAAIAHAAFETALPLCVPQAPSTLYRLGVWLEYSTPSRLAALDRKSLEFRNESCDESVAVSERLVWEAAGRGELIDLRAESLVEVNAPAIDCAADGARIRCVGTLPPAICEPGEEGELVVVQPTEWAHSFAPTLSTAEQEYESQGLSRFIEAEDGGPLCVALTRDAVSEVSHMRFRLIAANARQRSVFFESPVETLRAHLETRYDSPPHRIDVEFRAGDAAQSGRVCVTLESDPCGF